MIKRPVSRQPIPATAQKVFEGKIFSVYQWEQRLYDGTTAVFEKLQRPDTAYVIPVMDDHTLLVIRQKQPGSAEAYGLIGGRVEAGETPDFAARRELLEETGLIPGSIVLWDSYQFLPKIEWAIFTYIARGCVKAPRNVDPGEKIELIRVTFDGLLDLVKTEAFGDVEVALRLLRIVANPNKLAETKQFILEGPHGRPAK